MTYTVSLRFDEIVDPDSVNMSSLRVQNQASNPTATYYFSGQTNVTRDRKSTYHRTNTRRC